MVGPVGLEVGGGDIETVAMGFKVIFPCLTGFEGHSDGWCQVESKLEELRR